MKTITVEQLKKDLDANVDFILVDARDTKAYARAHIPQAKCISPDCGDECIIRAFPDKSQKIVTYCSSVDCELSKKLCQVFEKLGYQDVWHYAGGIKEWIWQKHPVEDTKGHVIRPSKDRVTQAVR